MGKFTSTGKRTSAPDTKIFYEIVPGGLAEGVLTAVRFTPDSRRTRSMNG